jgi:hypothetical protein
MITTSAVSLIADGAEDKVIAGKLQSLREPRTGGSYGKSKEKA